MLAKIENRRNRSEFNSVAFKIKLRTKIQFSEPQLTSEVTWTYLNQTKEYGPRRQGNKIKFPELGNFVHDITEIYFHGGRPESSTTWRQGRNS